MRLHLGFREILSRGYPVELRAKLIICEKFLFSSFREILGRVKKRLSSAANKSVQGDTVYVKDLPCFFGNSKEAVFIFFCLNIVTTTVYGYKKELSSRTTSCHLEVELPGAPM